MSSSTGAAADEAVSKQSKVDKAKEKSKTISAPSSKSSSLLQTIASLGSSQSRNARSSSLRTSPQSHPSRLPSTTERSDSAHTPPSSHNMPPPPVPLTATASSSSSPGATPTMKNTALPSGTIPSKSDPQVPTTNTSHPRVSFTPPEQHTPYPPSAAPTHPMHPASLHTKTRPRGQSTSTIRPDISPTSSISRQHLGAAPMTRVISNPLPQPTSRAPSPTRGAGRGRAVSLSSTNTSAAASREPSATRSARNASPLRDLARSFHSFSTHGTPTDSRPSTAHGLPPHTRVSEEDERRYWWHSRAATPRPWFEDGTPVQAQEPLPPLARGERGSPASGGGAVLQREHVSLWHRRGSIPPEQSESFTRTEKSVNDVKKEILDTLAEVAHEALEIGADVLEFVPIAGLAEAARILAGIWDAVQLVEFNRLACLRLTERCATILLAVKQEIDEADRALRQAESSSPKLGTPSSSHVGLPHTNSSPKVGVPHSKDSIKRGMVGNKLKAPLDRLTAAFTQVLEFLERQNRRPFLKRYLKRDEIERDVVACHTALTDALSMFEVSIQIRTLERIYAAEARRQEDMAAFFEQLRQNPQYQLPPYQSPQTYAQQFVSSPVADPGSYPPALIGAAESSGSGSGSGGLLLQGVQPPLTPQPLGSIGLGLPPIDDTTIAPEQPPSATPAAPLPAGPAEVCKTIAALMEKQNEHDAQYDLLDLREMMTRALERNDDGEMMRLLQIKPEDAPEALKVLQRALEDETAREREERSAVLEDGPPPELDASVGSVQGIVDGVVGRAAGASVEALRPSLSRRPTAEWDAHAHSRRSTASQTSSSHTRTSHASHDTLHREFMESGIASLVRLSAATGTPLRQLSLPAWTITRYEVDLERSIGIGSFSEVWKGRYRGRTVAVKVLQPWTPKELFLQEVHVWNELRHKNVLEMVGASAVESPHVSRHGTGSSGIGWDTRTLPWFIVSRYYERGSLVKWIKTMPKDDWEIRLNDPSIGVLRMIHEIVQGMEYLHRMDVLHGDLKGANVLVNDYGHCIISDFGQSELKSEVYRLSGTALPHGTLRWQAPELMAGHSKLTPEVDVYAFAVSCVEILTKGAVPWPLADDNAVRHFVLTDNIRPELPQLRLWSAQLADLINQCWHRTPAMRPSFATLNHELAALRRHFGWAGINEFMDGEAADEDGWIAWIDELDRAQKSPPLLPNAPLPPLAPDVIAVDLPSSSESGTYVTARGSWQTRIPSDSSAHPPPVEPSISDPTPDTASAVPSRVGPSSYSAPGGTHPHSSAPTIHSPRPSQPGSRISSLGTPSEEDQVPPLSDIPTYPSPHPTEDHVSEGTNERRYRMLLEHEFNRSLTLPLWSPSPVALGAVGYHQKPDGNFVTLFNAFRPLETSSGKTRGMPSLDGYGGVSVASQRSDKRNLYKRKWDQLQDWIARGKEGSPRSVSRRYSATLRNGHKTAHLFTESTMYRYVADPDLKAPRRWFTANVDQILDVYGSEHLIQKEDLMLVIGTLDAPDWAMFVSHRHPDGQVNFNVFGARPLGQKWGEFTTTTDVPESGPSGPVYNEDMPLVVSASKVSDVKREGEQWDTVLLAKLRFPTDKEEPTSL